MASSADYLPVNGRFRVIETRLPREADVRRVLASGGSLSDIRALLQGSVLELPADGSGSVVSQFDQAYAVAYQTLLEAVEKSAPGSAVTQWIRTRSQWVQIRSSAKQLIEDVVLPLDALTALRSDRSGVALDVFDQLVAVVQSVRSDLASADSDAARESAWVRARAIDVLADQGMMQELRVACKADREREIRVVLRALYRLMQVRVAVRLSLMESEARPSLPAFDEVVLERIVLAQREDDRRAAVLEALEMLESSHREVLVGALKDATSFEHAVLFVEHALLAGRASGMEGAIPVLAFFTSLERTALMVRVALMTASFGLDAAFMSQRLESIGMNA